MKHVCLQAGHEHAGAGMSKGAPGEVEFNVDVRNQVAGQLREKGFDVTTADANSHHDENVTNKDYDLFLAIHYDADVYNDSGGFVDYPEPSTDGATEESQRIAKILSDAYFKETGIKNKPERSNANTRYYYFWQYLSKKTPCNIIECGVGWRVPKDHNLFTYEREKVVNGIVKGICEALDVSYEPELTCEEKIKNAVSEAEVSWREKLAEQQVECQKKLLEKDIKYENMIWKKVEKLSAVTLIGLGLKKLIHLQK